MLHNCSDSISIARIQYETRFPSKHHRPHLIRVLADQLRSVTKARAQYEIIPLIEIRILRLIDPKISKLVFFTNHQNHRITPQLATVGEKKRECLFMHSVSTLHKLSGALFQGHSCKIGNMRCPGTLKIKILNLKKRNKFFLFFYVSISHPRRKKYWVTLSDK